MKNKHLLLLLVASTLSMAAFFNTDLRTRIQEGLLHYIRTQLPEKVYVQTDKPYYTSGETIWFKAYLVEAVAHTPNSKSQVIHVDLINPDEEILATRTLYSYQGGAAGDFALADSVASGTYLLRAYTQHMRNADPDYFFTKEIPVFYQTAEEVGEASLTTNTSPTEPAVFKPDIQFLPESGELVDGLPTVLGIKAMTAEGQSVETSGKIVDAAGEIVAFFKTYQFGLGFARLTPKSGEQYTAVAVVNGVEYVYDLPKVRAQGYVLTIDNSGEKIRFRMSTNRPQGLTDMLLVGHVRRQLFCAVEGEADKSVMVGELSTKDIPDGIAHFTLFSLRAFRLLNASFSSIIPIMMWK